MVIRRETVGIRPTGDKGKETEMVIEEGNGERKERVGRVPLYSQQHLPLPPVLPTSHLQRNPSPRMTSLLLELCRRKLHRWNLLINRAGQERTRHLIMARASLPLIPQGKTWRSQTRRRRILP